MNRKIVEQKIITIIQNIVADNSLEIRENYQLIDDLEFSSLEAMELLAELEDEFDCIIEERKSRDFVTVKDIVDYMCSIKGVAS